jgi:uncharacterized protein (TIGR02099 family)
MSNSNTQQSLFLKVFSFAINKIWLLFSICIISLATIFLLLELALPEVNRYKPEIVNWLENNYQIDIKVDTISAEWSSTGPSLSLINFSVLSDDKKFKVFEVGSLSIDFDLLASVLNREYSTHSIQLRNANIRFYIDRKLGVKLNAFTKTTNEIEEPEKTFVDSRQIEDASKRFFDLLVAQKKIEIRNSNLELMTLEGASFNYKVENLAVKKYANNHQLVGQLEHVTDSVKHSNSIKLIAEIFHGDEEKNNYTNLYIDVDKIDLASLPKIGRFFDKGNLSNNGGHNNVVGDKDSELIDDTEIDVTKMDTTGPDVRESIASLHMWSRWQNRHWQSVDAQFDLSGGKDLSAILSWRNDDYHHGYATLHNLTINNSNVKNNNIIRDDGDVLGASEGLKEYKSPQLGNIVFKYLHEEKENISWDILINNFDLSPLLNYLPLVLSNNVDGMDWLTNSEASLKLEHLKVKLTKNKLRWASSDLTAEFSKLKIKNKINIPTFSKLKGWLLFDLDKQVIQGEVGIEGEGGLSELVIDELFREIIPVEQFSVNVMSDLSSGFNELNITDLVFVNTDLELNASAKFYFDNEKPNLSLKAKILRGNVSQTSRYLPTGIMSESLVEYLDSSIKKGKLIEADAILRGPIEEFPYPNSSGVFAVLAKIENVNYQYLPAWPLVTKVKANLLFEGNGMEIKAVAGESLDNKLNSAVVGIADMSSEDAILELDLDIDSSNNQGREFLKQSPLDFISNGLESLDFHGEMKTKIVLTVPLSDDSSANTDNKTSDSEISLLGSVQPISQKFNLSLPFVQVGSVKGELAFNEKGIIQSEMSGHVNNQLIHAKIQSVDKYDAVNKEYTFMELDLKGVFSSSTIDQFVDGNWSEFASGQSDFISKIIFINNDNAKLGSKNKSQSQSKIKVNFSSDLAGVSFEMPDFLNKKKSKSTPFKLDLTFLKSETSQSQMGYVDWNGFNVEWLIKPDNEYSAFINIIDNDVSTEDVEEDSNEVLDMKNDKVKVVTTQTQSGWNYPNGITMQGRVNQVDLIKWMDFIEKIKINYSLALDSTDISVKNSDRNVEWTVNKLDLSVKEILIPGVKEVSLVKLNADKYLELPWRLILKSQQGNIDVIFDEENPWLINAANIDLDFVDTTNVIEAFDELDNEKLETKNLENDKLVKQKLTKEQSERHLAVYTSLPEMDLRCNSCKFNQKNVGSFRSSIRKNIGDNHSIILKAKADKGEEHQLSLSAIWSMVLSEQIENEYLEETNIDFTLSTNNVGTMLKSWGFKPSVEDSKGKVTGNLSWANSPWRVEYKELSGFARLDFGKGYLSQISDADGRIIALFNLKSILRKLTFDFKDVYKKGFFYESMGGTVEIDNGILSTYDTSIKGNVADVLLFGTTDLITETVEQHAIVSPHITSSVPVLAAWALEPTTGIILYLLNKIMEPAIDVATQIDYRVHGSFDKPIVDEIKKSKKRVKINLDDAGITKEQKDSLTQELTKDVGEQKNEAIETINKTGTGTGTETATEKNKSNIKIDVIDKESVGKDATEKRSIETTVIKKDGDNNG